MAAKFCLSVATQDDKLGSYIMWVVAQWQSAKNAVVVFSSNKIFSWLAKRVKHGPKPSCGDASSPPGTNAVEYHKYDEMRLQLIALQQIVAYQGKQQGAVLLTCPAQLHNLSVTNWCPSRWISEH